MKNLKEINIHSEVINTLKQTIYFNEDRLYRESDDNPSIKHCYKSALLFMDTYPQDMKTPELIDEYDGSVSIFWNNKE